MDQTDQKAPSFVVLLAPPAWGKTSLLLQMLERQDAPWIYISPLRALADEFYRRVRGIVKTHYIERRSDLEALFRSEGPPPRLVVGTPETLREEGASWALKVGAHFILDELHLFYLWGKSFRPWLLEYLYIVGDTGQNILGLTGTFAEEWMKECQEDFTGAGYEYCVEDWGNFKWEHPPSEILYYGPYGGTRLRRQFVLGLAQKKASLLFCRTRLEVENWVDFCKRKKLLVVGCVGGGVPLFKKELKKTPRPQVIVCTSVLGHGVNLPPFSAIYLSYVVENQALWLQMAARGGRQGENFTLHCLNWPSSSFWERVRRWLITWKVEF